MCSWGGGTGRTKPHPRLAVLYLAEVKKGQIHLARVCRGDGGVVELEGGKLLFFTPFFLIVPMVLRRGFCRGLN